MPRALRAAGFEVVRTMAEVYGDRAAQGLDDVDWIPEAARLDFVILSKDAGLRYGAEREAILEAHARVFLLPDSQMPSDEQNRRYVENRHRIANRCRRNGPYIYVVRPARLERYQLGG